MMMMWCSEDLQLWHASLQWVMEDLQWCDTSLWMNKVTRTYNGGAPHSLLGGGEGSSPATSPSWAAWCGTTFASLWWLHQCHPGTLYLTAAWTAAWPDLKCSASLLGGATIEKLVFEVQPNGCS